MTENLALHTLIRSMNYSHNPQGPDAICISLCPPSVRLLSHLSVIPFCAFSRLSPVLFCPLPVSSPSLSHPSALSQ